MSRTSFLRRAASEIGFVEKQPNVTPYWAALKPEWQGSPYCAAGLSYIALKTGEAQILPGGKPVYYVPYIEAHARANGRWYSTPQVGDWVVFSFGAALGIHVGVVEKVKPATTFTVATIQTVEFNTSPSNGGSQSNGGGVYRRVRPTNWGIRGYYRPAYHPEPKPASAVPALPGQVTPKNLVVDGDLGPLTVAAINRWTGRGNTSRWDKAARVALQKKIGVKPDSIVGKKTVTRLQTVVGAKPDGDWGKNTTIAIQKYLNRR